MNCWQSFATIHSGSSPQPCDGVSAVFGAILLITILIAWGIASYRSRGQSPSLGRFLARFLGAWFLVAFTLVALVYGAFAVVFGGAHCFNCG